ncbi:hypothetical protein OBBRIDRAFT_740156 [Obba rivulosa]|uniref:Uncharacterized protein n=1 Tax=Obba rivulosa TaxID=1052685 RepID=A0A8E2AL00_9APHY|nr:hypothetical protein OBBRIDRAFT_740156 [Obba rivulosa]
MRRDSSDSPFDSSLIPTQREVEVWDKDKDGPCCTATSFRPDLTSPPGTKWNIDCVQIFAEDFVKYHTQYEHHTAAVRLAFSTHLRKQLRNDYTKMCAKGNLEAEAAYAARSKHANRQQRKRTLFRRRYEMALGYEELKPHAAMLQEFGVDGMSSDESEQEDKHNKVHYHVLIKPWRSPQVTPWLRAFDAVYFRSRINSTGGNTRGAFPHMRMIGPRVSSARGAVPGLLLNAYSPSWLVQLGPY